MKPYRRSMSPYDRVIDEIAREQIGEIKAVTDYNIMMGTLEDPAAEEEEEELQDE